MVNDGLSHVVGDKILKEIGRRLQSCIRNVDTVARFGADEFVPWQIGAVM
jgi:diguanylate cyclase (GGDEF)-like protein